MDDCLRCKNYKNCTKNCAWFSYQEIRWCPYQILWIISNTETLRLGSWPPNPDGSGYIDPQIKTGYRSEAYYTKPVEILAEVLRRLKRTGTDGKLLKAQVENGRDIEGLEPEARSALMYVKGNRAKRMSYQRWLRHRRYREMLTKTTTSQGNNK